MEPSTRSGIGPPATESTTAPGGVAAGVAAHAAVHSSDPAEVRRNRVGNREAGAKGRTFLDRNRRRAWRDPWEIAQARRHPADSRHGRDCGRPGIRGRPSGPVRRTHRPERLGLRVEDDHPLGRFLRPRRSPYRDRPTKPMTSHLLSSSLMSEVRLQVFRGSSYFTVYRDVGTNALAISRPRRHAGSSLLRAPSQRRRDDFPSPQARRLRQTEGR